MEEKAYKRWFNYQKIYKKYTINVRLLYLWVGKLLDSLTLKVRWITSLKSKKKTFTD